MFARTLSVLLSLLALSAPAQAGDGSVGLAALGGEIGGAAAGFVVGGGLGVVACRASQGWECYMPLMTAPIGGLVGGIAGASWAGGKRAEKLGLADRSVRRWTAAVGLGGVALSAGGLELESEPLLYGGLAVTALGMPVAAGLAAGDGGVSLAPTWSREAVGLRVSGSF